MLQLWNNTREMAFKFTSDDSKHKIFTLSEEEFKEPIQDEYAKEIGALSPAELYDNYNPGFNHFRQNSIVLF
ncbi:unnamed protein product [Anisakis simplex]|uniref:KTSC domain-containing protein n=1 Tax=Anisakis simplex TaxID=6269 RepID=A0A0M3KCP4_ANISI|nr:unnamed protein product [Anisakis simplex]